MLPSPQHLAQICNTTATLNPPHTITNAQHKHNTNYQPQKITHNGHFSSQLNTQSHKQVHSTSQQEKNSTITNIQNEKTHVS